MSSDRARRRPGHLRPVDSTPPLRLIRGLAAPDAAADSADSDGPMLNPSVRVLWRSGDVVQLELGARAVVVDGVDPDLVGLLATRRGVRAGAAAGPAHPAAGATSPKGEPHRRPNRAIGPAATTLLEQGFLWPAGPGAHEGTPADARLTPPVPRLAGELASMTPRHGAQSAAVLLARRGVAVAVHGTGRAAAHIAAVLAAAGVGRVHVVDSEPVTLRHALPGGLLPADEGRPFAAAVADAVRRVAPDTDLTPLPMGQRPDLVIVACDEPVGADQRQSLHARRCTHLTVRLNGDTGAVGPLVLPGLSSCLRCADLHRRDRDPAWGALAAQLSVPPRYGPASDAALATTIAGIAAREALAYLDGEEPATVDATLEIQLPDWRIRRRSWSAHEQCECGVGSAT